MTRRLRSWICVALFGGHELYTVRSATRVYQCCVLCGHQTPGWDVPPALKFRSTWMRSRTP